MRRIFTERNEKLKGNFSTCNQQKQGEIFKWQAASLEENADKNRDSLKSLRPEAV